MRSVNKMIANWPDEPLRGVCAPKVSLAPPPPERRKLTRIGERP